MKITRFLTAAAGLCLLAACASTPSPVASAGQTDPETAAWWKTTLALSGPDMEGRDTGSPGHARAVAYTADRLRKAGLKPAGDSGTWVQTIAFRDLTVLKDGTSATVRRTDGTSRSLRFLHEYSVAPTPVMAQSIDAPLVFRGYCGPTDMYGVAGKAVVCVGNRRQGGVSAADRVRAVTTAGAAALITVDDPHFSQEPPRFPVAYARAMWPEARPAPSATLPSIRLAADALAPLIAGSGQDAAALLLAGSKLEALPAFDIPATLQARFALQERRVTSDNVLGVLPGTDPTLANEPVLLTAHIDGYGFGEPVDGDGLYDGTFDNAAYVATLIEFAERRAGRGLKRPVVIAALTGEEKGLWGARWLADNPTPAALRPIAVLNLDQLRPLYPLTILTMLALEDSTLGDTVRQIAGGMGIEVRPDREPERNLLRRTDHWPFLEKGIPVASFLFGFDAGTDAEARYLDWYRRRYHTPLDDPSTPVDWKAAGDFNRFWYTLVETVADADKAPSMKPDSPFKAR